MEVLRKSVDGCGGHASIGHFFVWFRQPEQESHVGPPVSRRTRFLAVVCGQRACLSGGTLFVAHVQCHHSPTKTNDIHERFEVGLRRVLSSGHFFRHELSAKEKSRFLRFEQIRYIIINILELLAILVGACMLVVTVRRQPVTAIAFCCGDNISSVAWIRPCRGGKSLAQVL